MTSAYSLLLFLVLGIFLFCYFVATRVWIKVDDKKKETSTDNEKKDRRDFLYLSSITLGGVGAASFMWPFLKSMNPAEDTLALGSTEVDYLILKSEVALQLNGEVSQFLLDVEHKRKYQMLKL